MGKAKRITDSEGRQWLSVWDGRNLHPPEIPQSACSSEAAEPWLRTGRCIPETLFRSDFGRLSISAIALKYGLEIPEVQSIARSFGLKWSR